MERLIVVAVLTAAAWVGEYLRLKREKRMPELLTYTLFSAFGLALFSVYILWKDMPSVLDVMRSALGQNGR